MAVKVPTVAHLLIVIVSLSVWHQSWHIRNLLATAVNILSHAPGSISTEALVSHCSLLGISHFLHQLCLRAMTSSSSRLHQVSEND